MRRIPKRYLRTHTVTVRPYLGESSTGAVLGAPFAFPCMAQGKRRMVRNADGDQVLSTLTLYAEHGGADAVPPGSEVDWRGDTTTVIASADHDAGDLPTPNHTEVVCE